eukprot:s502_g43.t1
MTKQVRKPRAAKNKKVYRPSKPQEIKKDLRKLRISRAIRKPHIFREKPGCKGLVLGQAPPGPRETLPRGWRPLAGPAEQRLARLAGMSVEQLWGHFDRARCQRSVRSVQICSDHLFRSAVCFGQKTSRYEFALMARSLSEIIAELQLWLDQRGMPQHDYFIKSI